MQMQFILASMDTNGVKFKSITMRSNQTQTITLIQTMHLIQITTAQIHKYVQMLLRLQIAQHIQTETVAQDVATDLIQIAVH